MTKEVSLPLTQKEHDLLEMIASRDGISIEEAASKLVHQGIQTRVRRNTGRAPAKVYDISKGGKK